ncbi:MAG: enoyl-CoA hydratase/isomerase family protein [Solirubrobacterales bacterium]|nr:enoyl-CoA hydratase/isomerase family protein [Solirubrobacterales bacterium]
MTDEPGGGEDVPMSDKVAYSVDENGVALIRLERAETRNALNTEMLEAILAYLVTAREDGSVRALVISSDDQMGLSAGADVREALDPEGRVHRMELFSLVYDELTAFPKPTCAACHGACVGGGAEIAIACDLRVGGANLRLRFPGAALGVPVGPARLVTLCGLSVAKYLLLTGRELGIEEAHRWGLVHQVVPAARTEAAAIQLATSAAAHPPEATKRLKRMLHEWDGVEERSQREGEGQVEWQRSGPGLPFRDA